MRASAQCPGSSSCVFCSNIVPRILPEFHREARKDRVARGEHGLKSPIWGHPMHSGAVPDRHCPVHARGDAGMSLSDTFSPTMGPGACAGHILNVAVPFVPQCDPGGQPGVGMCLRDCHRRRAMLVKHSRKHRGSCHFWDALIPFLSALSSF